MTLKVSGLSTMASSVTGAQCETGVGSGQTVRDADSQNLCATCSEPADKLFESPFSGDRLCGECFDAEQLEAFSGTTPAEGEQYRGIRVEKE